MTDLDAPEPSGALPAKLRRPVMIAAFEGWNDAGDAATNAVEQLSLGWDAEPLAEIDPEAYYDFQVSRPNTKLVDGVTRMLEWPTTRLTVVRFPRGHQAKSADAPAGDLPDVILVHGIEPNFRWKAFCAELLELAEQQQVASVICLGALLADVPHTRPVQVTGTAPDPQSAEQLGLTTSRYEGPTGITGVFADTCVQAGIPAYSFWAAVPHYVAQGPHPKATLALLDRIEELLGRPVPTGSLAEQAAEWETEVSDIAAQDEDITEYIHALEESSEPEVLRPASGDSIAAEFERYLRRREPGDH
ncbi:PAC2 family protein [Nakamurella aerolata]|uniref:PAC2 family protein n=1 Tax=Nakamurella aerolata TaxID=1656892 RepID=A0A849A2S5_9ACTN|nr:PAC2 family protein [Nakamurella aerolata]NNG34377.1 PAC2 family protein [Nakamurella aerolata]